MQRPAYRSGRIDRAVKTYTVCDESRYLIVRNVPALGCADELVKLFGSYGEIEEYRTLDEEDCEPFTDVYWIKYAKYNNARFAKRKLDNYKFLGNLLDVAYAPNEETSTDTKNKLEERSRAVLNKIQANSGAASKSSTEDFSQSHDRHLQIPSDSQQFPRFQGQLLPRNSRQHTISSTTSLPQPQRSTEGAHEKSLTASMTSTVHAIREKLNKISEVGLVAPTTGQQIHEASVDGGLEHKGQSKRAVEDTVSPPTKKRQDTRDTRRRI